MRIVQESITNEKFNAQIDVEKTTQVVRGEHWKIVSLEIDDFERFTPKGLRELGAWLIYQGSRIGREYNHRGEKKHKTKELFMSEAAKELTEIKELLERAIDDAKKFDSGNDAAGTRVRKDCHAARARLLGLRNMVSEVRKERKAA